MCKRPLIGYPNGYTDKGKIKYRIRGYKDALYEHLATPTEYVDGLNQYGNPILIPCGKCLECRLDYARQWSQRCMLELKNHQSSLFLTLTYDDDHLSYSGDYPTLVKKDLQDFIKRLRYYCSNQYIYLRDEKNKILKNDKNEKIKIQSPLYTPDPLKHYSCGEYGSTTHRPHYHSLVFGLSLPDLEEYSRTPLGDTLYSSKIADEIWKQGQVRIGEVTPQSCAYVAGYVNKKAKADYKDKYLELGMQPEFNCMSLRPAIGREFSDQDPVLVEELYEKGYLSISTEKGGTKVYPPRYYEQFYEQSHPEEYKALKDKRIHDMEQKVEQLNATTSKDFLGRLSDEEINLEARTKSLVRTL